MPSSQEIARVMAEMDRFNQSAKVTVTEERYEKRVASVGGSYGGLTALLQQGAPGNWASDHKSEAEKFAGWHYVAISSIGKAVRSANCEAYQEKIREYAKAYNEQDDDTEPLPKWHPLMKLLKRPNPSQSGASFREEVAIQLCLTGSALIWNVPNQMGRTVERYVIPTAIAEPRQPERGRPKGGWYINPEVARWQIESGWFLYTGLATAIGKVIDARDVQVIRFIHPVFKDEGQSPVSAGALWTDTSEKVDISRHSHLRNGSDPSVIIGIDGVEDEGTLQRMSAKFNEKYAGPSKHGKAMFVNGQNVKIEPVTRTPAEMAYEGAFVQFRDAIMALHGVTPIAAGIEAPSGDDGLYAPLKQFISGTVQPILDLMAEEDTEQLAGQFGEGISVLYTAKAVDDAKLTEQQINTDILAGAIEVDEIRKIRGRKPWGGEKGKAVAGQGAKEEPKPGLPGLAQGVPGLEPQTGSQALDPSKPPQGTPDPMKLAEEAVAKALGGFADRLSALLKSGDNCGTGGGGFQPGNTCGKRDGKGSESAEGGGKGASVNPKILAWAREKFGDDTTAENFAKWFGDSKVVDEDGNPLTVYHGAEDYRSEVDGIFVTDDPEMATRYAELKAIEQAVSENSELEEIVYEVMADEGADTLTDLGPERVREIADANGFEIPNSEGKVDSLWVRSENPLDLREHGSDVGDVGELWDSMHSAGLLDESWDSLDDEARYEVESQYDGKALYNFLEDEGIQAKAFERGYDSVVFVDIAPDGGATHDSWLVKQGDQVKSDRNSGKFSRDSKDVTKSAASDSYNPPESARNNARKVLRWKEQHGDAVRGMTATGWARANQLASGEKLSRETVGRMAAFARHRKNSKVDPKFRDEPWRDAGYVAWLGWGGDSGINWAAGVIAGEGKSGSGCGANAEGGGGFQPGNTCGKEDGAGEAGAKKKKEVDKVNSLLERAAKETGIDELTIVQAILDAKVNPENSEAVAKFLEAFEAENKGKPLAWEPAWDFDPNKPSDLSPKARARMMVAHEIRKQFRDSLKEANLSNEKKAAFLKSVQDTLMNMPIGALTELNGSINSIEWHASKATITSQENARRVKAGAKPIGGQIGGIWVENGRKLVVNGDSFDDTARGIYAHEFAHAIDSSKRSASEFAYPEGHSNNRNWELAWKEEIYFGSLSAYAKTNREEGFAEFARLAWSGKKPSEIQESFPKCYQYFKDNGLIQ